jgi:TolB-like protein/Tfp pilus assembly protein PilF
MSFIKELKRRNVIRVAIAYVIVAWLLLQVADVVLNNIEAPDWVFQAILLLVAIGFPFALIFAWAFELTPEGLKREHEVDRSESITHVTGRKLDFTIIGVMAIAIAYFLADKFVWVGEEPATTVAVSEERPSVAVLPFANRSAKEDDAFFVDGIHDDLLSHISKIGSIKIISRTSVLQYRDTTKTIPQIAEELGVATVLEGGVQRAGEQVRINVQLIDARTDEHLWSEIYDRQLSAANIFTIQSEIATAIAKALQAALSPEEQDRLQAVPTENLAALEAYFHGKQRMAKRTSGALAEAVEYFQQAIELDPDFALAYVGLADSYLLQVIYSGLPNDEVFPKVEAAIDKALELDDQLGEAYASLGSIKQQMNDFQDAEVAYKRALELNPNYATAHHWYTTLLGRLGRSEEALARIRKAQELDPLSAIINLSVGSALSTLGRFDEALAQYKKVIEIDPALPHGPEFIGDIYWAVSGQLDEAAGWYRQAIALDPGNPTRPALLGFIYLDLGDVGHAEDWINRSMALGPDSRWPNSAMAFLHMYRGEDAEALDFARKALTIDPTAWFELAYLRNHDLQAGRYAEARARYEKSYPALLNDNEPTIDITNFRPAIDLAYVLSKTGEQERADLLLDRSLTFIETIPRLGLAGFWVSDVKIYAQQGKTEAALAALRQAIDQGWRTYWWYYLEHDKNLDSIRHEPEFQAMVEEIKADMAAQLERLRAMEASGKLEPIPEVN